MMNSKEIAQKLAPGYWKRDQLNLEYFDSVGFAEALIEAYKAELLKEVGEPVYQVCKSDSVSLSSAWIDVTEQTYNDAGLYPEYGRRILYTSDQLAAAIIRATKPLEERRCEICGYAEHHREYTSCLRTQLAAAQEEIERLENQVLARDAELWGRTQEILGLKDQLAKAEQLWQVAQGRCDGLEEKLAKAEQRVAEACKSMCLRLVRKEKNHAAGYGFGYLNYSAQDVADFIDNGEWRKFVKEEL